MASNEIKVLLVDDHKIFLDGLCELLSKEEAISVVGKASGGREALKLVPHCNPDIVVMDITMPDMNGIDTTKMLSQRHPHIKIIALSMHLDRGMISQVLEAGARGYILKDCSIDEFVRGIKAVSQDLVYLTPKAAKIVLEDYLLLKKGGVLAAENKLSPREMEVLRLLVKGEHTKS
ncbi:response regulator, partial [Acetomicrobium hydrogeniformans]